MWNIFVKDADTTAGEFFRFGLVKLASQGAATLEDSESRGSDTLTLHCLQMKESAHVTDIGRLDVTVEDVYEFSMRGMSEGESDIDALNDKDFVSHREDLCWTEEPSEDRRGGCVNSSLAHQPVRSLTGETALK